MELFKASQQWSKRPQDERFSSIQDAYSQALTYAQSAQEKTDIHPATLRVIADGGEVALTGKGAIPARLTHWSFGQVAARAGAPAGYLRTLPATLAANNINHGLAQRYGTALEPKNLDETVNILAHSNGDLLVRAFTSDVYSRIWNHDLLRRMLQFKEYGWDCPVAFQFANGSAGTNGRAPEKTIYVSDHDMFVFQVNNDKRIAEPGNPEGLGRGFFVENSEVGKSKVRVTSFLYRYVCCNHIVWGAKDVTEFAFAHVGQVGTKVEDMMDRLETSLKTYSNDSVSDIEAQIKSAKTRVIDTDKEKLLDALFKNLRGDVTRKQLEAAHTIAVENEKTDGEPNTVWAMAQGITRLSQKTPFADDRVTMDRAAGRLIDMAF